MNKIFILLIFIFCFSCEKTNRSGEKVSTSIDRKRVNHDVAAQSLSEDDKKISFPDKAAREPRPNVNVKIDDYIGRGNLEVNKLMDIPPEVEPLVSVKDDIVEVTWPDALEPEEEPSPRSGYYAIVRFNKLTGELLEVLVSP